MEPVGIDSAVLNINQTTQELDGIYSRDYYWYLGSHEFENRFLIPISCVVNNVLLAQSCLDVGCGEGQLSKFIRGRYLGVDACEVAIARARVKCAENWADRIGHSFKVGRFESPRSFIDQKFDVVVFGNIFEVLVKPEHRMAFIAEYIQLTECRHFIIYDLMRLDTSPMESKYHLIQLYQSTADLVGIEDTKRHRKIMVFRC